MSRDLLRHVAVPLMFLTAALLGGLRIGLGTYEMRFIPPPLVTLLLAACLVTLFARARLFVVGEWLDAKRPPLENLSNGLTLVTAFVATVQVFNAVLPEDTLFFAIFVCFFALLFLNNFFVVVQPIRFVRALGALLLVTFVAKYVVLTALFEPSESLTKTVVQALLKGVTLGGMDAVTYARATGYTAFAAVVLYLVALWASSPPPDPVDDALFALLADRDSLRQPDRRRALAALARAALPDSVDNAIDAEIVETDAAE